MAPIAVVAGLLAAMKLSMALALRRGDVRNASFAQQGNVSADAEDLQVILEPVVNLSNLREGGMKLVQTSQHPEHLTGSTIELLKDPMQALEKSMADPLAELKELEETDPLDATDETEAHGEHKNENFKAILFFVGVLALGAIMVTVLERRFPGIPYTCALFVAGALVDYIHHLNKRHDHTYKWDSWFDAMELWEQINPHTLFYSFLPALIFSEAMKLNVRMVHECFWQVLLLACPGVLIGTVSVGCFVHFLLPYGWNWPVSLVFGSIVSATDPVAVVALFNTLGVSPRLTMLVSGESLLNDGTAIVVFALMLKVAMGVSLSPWGIVAFFGHMTMVSVVLGCTISIIAVIIIRYCAEESYKNDMMVQVITTICTGYLSFFIAESEVSTSGVITTVTAGFVIAYAAWPSFVNSHTMHTVWETIEFVGNTVIFFLAGLKFMDVVIIHSAVIALIDWGWLVVLYMVLTLIRAMMIAILWKPLNAVGAPISFPEAVVMVWSGLRGAVSLSLALIVDLGPLGKTVGPHVVFHVGGIAALTFLVNATGAQSLLSWLRLTATADSKNRMLRQFTRANAKCIQEDFLKCLSDERFEGAEEEVVRIMVPILNPHTTGLSRSASASFRELNSGEEIELLIVYRQCMLRLVKYQYNEMIEGGLMPRNMDVARYLLHSTEKAESTAHLPLNDWDEVKACLGGGVVPEAIVTGLMEGSKYPPLSMVKSTLMEHFGPEAVLVQKVFASHFYRRAHSHARAKLPTFFDTMDGASLRLQGQVCDESEQQCKQAKAFLEEVLKEDGQNYWLLAKSEILARHLLHKQYAAVHKMQEMGLFSDAEAEELLEEVHVARRALYSASKRSPGHQAAPSSL